MYALELHHNTAIESKLFMQPFTGYVKLVLVINRENTIMQDRGILVTCCLKALHSYLRIFNVIDWFIFIHIIHVSIKTKQTNSQKSHPSHTGIDLNDNTEV